MKKQSISSSNPYLKKASASKRLITNVASSTSVETGKSSGTYIKRSAKTGRFLEVREPRPPKK